MSVLNTLLCGGRAAQPPEGKYGECFSYSLRYSLIISLRFFFSFAHFIVCFMSEIAQALPSSYAPGTSGYFFFLLLLRVVTFPTGRPAEKLSEGIRKYSVAYIVYAGTAAVRETFSRCVREQKNILCLHSMLCDSLFSTGRCTSQQTCSTYSVCCDGNATHR